MQEANPFGGMDVSSSADTKFIITGCWLFHGDSAKHKPDDGSDSERCTCDKGGDKRLDESPCFHLLVLEKASWKANSCRVESNQVRHEKVLRGEKESVASTQSHAIDRETSSGSCRRRCTRFVLICVNASGAWHQDTK